MDMADHDLAEALEQRLACVWGLVLRGSFRELSRTATSVLALLRDTGPRRITDLAGAQAVAQPTMTTLVARLERQGLAQRRPDPADARAVLVTLTAAGRQALERQGSERSAVLAARLQRLDDADRAALQGALAALDRLAQTPSPSPAGSR